MADLLFIAVTIAFFGLALLLVRACDSIIGPDTDLDTDRSSRPDTEPVGADGSPTAGTTAEEVAV